MESARIILTGRLANYLEQLHCRRDVSYRCRICRSYPIGYRTHRCKHIAVYSTTLLRRERSFFISIMVSSCTGREGTLCENYLRSCQPRENCAQKNNPNNIPTTAREPATGEPSSVISAGRDPLQSYIQKSVSRKRSRQNRVREVTECKVIRDLQDEVQICEVRSSSKFPTEATGWISEIGVQPGAWTNESRPVRCSDECFQTSRYWILQVASALKKLLTADFQEAGLLGRAQGTTGQSIPERKTHRLHDLGCDYLRVSATGAAVIDSAIY